MAAPAFGTAGTQVQTTASTIAVDVPDSVAAGDIIVVTAYVAADLGATITGLASGFAQAADSPVQVNIGLGGQHRIYVMWKRATGADSTGSTYDFTLSVSDYHNAQAIRYTGGISSGDPWDVTNSAESGNTNVSTTPAVSDTTTVADTLLVWAASNWNGGAWTPPSGFTERRDSGDQVCTVADLAQAVAGATGSITGTCASSNKSGAWLGALKSEVAAVDSSVYSVARLPGRIGPDGKVFTPGRRFDNNGVVAAATNAPAGDAAGTGSALQPTAALGVSAGVAAAAGSAPQPSSRLGASAGVAAATGTASQPTAAIQANAGVASAAGTAPQPVAAVRVNAGVAEASGSALQATVSTVPATNAPAGLAAATGTALQPTIAITVRPAAPTATGTAPQPTISISGSANAPAGLAAATGTALAPTIAVRALAGVAAGTGAANPATVTVGDIGFAGLASASGSALQPTIAIRAFAGVAAAVGTAPQAVGQGDLPVERISDPLTLAPAGQDLPLSAVRAARTLAAAGTDLTLSSVDAPLSLDALED